MGNSYFTNVKYKTYVSSNIKCKCQVIKHKVTKFQKFFKIYELLSTCCLSKILI